MEAVFESRKARAVRPSYGAGVIKVILRGAGIGSELVPLRLAEIRDRAANFDEKLSVMSREAALDYVADGGLLSSGVRIFPADVHTALGSLFIALLKDGVKMGSLPMDELRAVREACDNAITQLRWMPKSRKMLLILRKVCSELISPKRKKKEDGKKDFRFTKMKGPVCMDCGMVDAVLKLLKKYKIIDPKPSFFLTTLTNRLINIVRIAPRSKNGAIFITKNNLATAIQNTLAKSVPPSPERLFRLAEAICAYVKSNASEEYARRLQSAMTEMRLPLSRS